MKWQNKKSFSNIFYQISTKEVILHVTVSCRSLYKLSAILPSIVCLSSYYTTFSILLSFPTCISLVSVSSFPYFLLHLALCLLLAYPAKLGWPMANVLTDHMMASGIPLIVSVLLQPATCLFPLPSPCSLPVYEMSSSVLCQQGDQPQHGFVRLEGRFYEFKSSTSQLTNSFHTYYQSTFWINIFILSSDLG